MQSCGISQHLLSKRWLQRDESEGSFQAPEQLGPKGLDQEEGRGGLTHRQVRRHHRERFALPIQRHCTFTE